MKRAPAPRRDVDASEEGATEGAAPVGGSETEDFSSEEDADNVSAPVEEGTAPAPIATLWPPRATSSKTPGPSLWRYGAPPSTSGFVVRREEAVFVGL